MNGVKVLAFALFIVVQATSQDAPRVQPLLPNVFPYPVPRFPYPVPQVPYSVPQNASNLFATAPQIPHALPQDPSKLFPYAVPPEGTVNSPEQARCKFFDGKTITVDYSTRHVRANDLFFLPSVPPPIWATVFDGITFVSDASLTTVKGISVPPGAYKIVVPRNVWPAARTFMERDGDKLSVPFFYSELASRDEYPPISFEHTGASCVMRVYRKDSNTRASVEFREKDAGLPVTH